MMLHVIPHDFAVELIWNEGPDALFGAFRKGGRQVVDTADGPWETYTCGVWHFVAPEPADATGPIKRFGIRQWHLPRYTMAEALDELRYGHGEKVPGGHYKLVGPGFAIGVNDDGNVFWMPATLGGRPIEVPPAMLESVDADIEQLKSARAQVSEQDGAFEYAGI